MSLIAPLIGNIYLTLKIVVPCIIGIIGLAIGCYIPDKKLGTGILLGSLFYFLVILYLFAETNYLI